jgi:hypothetical protein
LWPIRPFGEGGGYVGILRRSGRTLELSDAIPLDVFGTADWAIFVYSEEHLADYLSPNVKTDMISLYCLTEARRVFAFSEEYWRRFADEAFIEVSHGVLDSPRCDFWFTAYHTSKLWRLSFLAKPQVETWPLNISRDAIVALTVNAGSPKLITISHSHLSVIPFSATRASEENGAGYSEFSLAGSPIARVLSEPQRRLSGLPGDLLAISSFRRALLLNVGSGDTMDG